MEEEAGSLTSPLESIPEEVLGLIFSFLSPFDVIVLGQSSKHLHRISKDPFLWRYFCIHEFGLSVPQDPSVPSSRIRPPPGMTWRTLFRNCCSPHFRLLNGIFTYYTVTSPSFSQHTQLFSENEANSDRFRFYYPPSVRDSSLFVRVLVNYRRYRVEYWHTSESGSPKKEVESINTHQGVLPFNGGMDRVGFNTHNQALELLPLSKQDFGFADAADNLCEALKIESFRPGLIFKNRTEFASLRGEIRCDISWADESALRGYRMDAKTTRFSTCHNGEVIICSRSPWTLVRVGVTTGRMQETSIASIVTQHSEEHKKTNTKKGKKHPGDVKAEILWEGGRWVLCFLNHKCVVVWDLHAQHITLQHQRQQQPPPKDVVVEEIAVEEAGRGPARIEENGNEDSREKREESIGEPAREGGEGVAAATKRKRRRGDEETKGENGAADLPTEVTCFKMTYTVQALCGDILAFGCRSGKVHVRDLSRPNGKRLTLMAHAKRKDKTQQPSTTSGNPLDVFMRQVAKNRETNSVEAIWVVSKEVISGAKGCLKAFSLNNFHEGKKRKKSRRTEPQPSQHPQHSQQPSTQEEVVEEDGSVRTYYIDNLSVVLQIVASASVVVARVLTGMWVCNRNNTQRLYFLGHSGVGLPRRSLDDTRHFFWLDKGRIVRDQGKSVEVWDFMARERCVNEWLRDLHSRKDNKNYLTFPPDEKQHDDEEEEEDEEGLGEKQKDESRKVAEEDKNPVKRKRKERERKEKRERAKKDRTEVTEAREKRREEAKERKKKAKKEREEKRRRKRAERVRSRR